jgi:hypothetical protein
MCKPELLDERPLAPVQTLAATLVAHPVRQET